MLLCSTVIEVLKVYWSNEQVNQRSFVQTSIVLRALTLVIVSSQIVSIVIQQMVLAGFLLVSKDMQSPS